MINKTTYRTQDGVEVRIRSRHEIDLWSDGLPNQSQNVEDSYTSILDCLPQTIRCYFTDDVPVLQIPFIVVDKLDSETYPKCCVVWELEHRDADGNFTVLVISRLFKTIKGLILEKELSKITPNINWFELSEEKLQIL